MQPPKPKTIKAFERLFLNSNSFWHKSFTVLAYHKFLYEIMIDQRLEFFSNCFNIIRVSFISIFKLFQARNVIDGQVYAIKRIPLNQSKAKGGKIEKEVKLLSSLNHENVVRYYTSWIEIITEVCLLHVLLIKYLRRGAQRNVCSIVTNFSLILNGFCSTHPYYRNSFGLLIPLFYYISFFS